MKEKIEAALSKLDHGNANHWTEDGLPRVETVRMLASDPSITRELISSNFPEFKRGAAQAPAATTQPAAEASSQSTAATEPAAPATAPAATPVTAQSNGAPAPAAAVLAPTEQPAPQEREMPLEKQLELLQAQREELRMHKIQVDQAFADITAKVDKLQTQIDEAKKETASRSHTETIQAFLKSENRQREIRGERWKAFTDTGLTLKDILPQKAPIDAALSSRRKK